jgi:hypothetical protein
VQPSNFAGDAYGWVTNQCGHVVIGLASATVAAAVGLWWPIPLAVAVAYWLVAEYLLQRAGLFLDGLTDAAFVGAGASAPAALAWEPWAAVGLCVATGLALAAGAWRRR